MILRIGRELKKNIQTEFPDQNNLIIYDIKFLAGAEPWVFLVLKVPRSF